MAINYSIQAEVVDITTDSPKEDKDVGFSDDKDRINLAERFKRLSPETVITIL